MKNYNVFSILLFLIIVGINNLSAQTLHSATNLKSTLEVNGYDTVKLDSVIKYKMISETDSIFNQRYIYTYKDSLVRTKITCNYDELSGQWQNIVMDSSFYNELDQMEMTITYKWNDKKSAWEFYSKTEYTYSPNTTINAFFNWDTLLNDWKNTNYFKIIVDPQTDKITLNEGYYWDALNGGTWHGSYKEAMVYNNNGEMVRDTVYNWSESLNDWLGKMEIEYFDEDGEDTLLLSYAWDEVSQIWENEGKLVTTYTSDGYNDFSESTYMLWKDDINDWGNNYKTKAYIYSHSTELEYYSWDLGLQQWYQMKMSDLKYSENSKIDTVIVYSWNNNAAAWDTSSLISYGYDDELRCTQYKGFYKYDTTSHKWKDGGMNIWEYDKDMTVLSVDYKFDTTLQQFVGSRKTTRTNSNPSVQEQYSWLNGDWYGTFKMQVLYDSQNNMEYVYNDVWNETDKKWDAYIRSYYYYSPYEISEGPSSIMNEGSIVGKAYPIPFNDFLTVELNSPSGRVEIIDILGKVVLNPEVIEGKNILHTDFLVTGTYFMRITGVNKLQSIVLMKR